jgi:hypothetical protein
MMQSLKVLEKYTLDKKKHQLGKLERYYSKSLSDIESYIKNQEELFDGNTAGESSKQAVKMV